jgi:calcineurin-like phosphoesterase family protein
VRRITALCISDHVDPLIYSDSIKERFGHIDLVLSAGDLDLSYYGYIVSTLNTRLAFVFGNHNLSKISLYRREHRIHNLNYYRQDDILQQTFGSTYVGDKVRNIEGVIVAGLGGSMRYNNGLNQYTETGMFFKALKLLPGLIFNRLFRGRWLDVLLTHAPPAGLHDRRDRCHRGFKTFLLIIKWFKPQYLVHGHVHLYDINQKRTSTYMQTCVVNAYEHTTIGIEVP